MGQKSRIAWWLIVHLFFSGTVLCWTLPCCCLLSQTSGCIDIGGLSTPVFWRGFSCDMIKVGTLQGGWAFAPVHILFHPLTSTAKCQTTASSRGYFQRVWRMRFKSGEGWREGNKREEGNTYKEERLKKKATIKSEGIKTDWPLHNSRFQQVGMQ